MTAPRFTLADLDRALLSWPVTCGPAAFAVICGLTLDEARAHFPGFRGWCNPTMMLDALRSAGRRFKIAQPGLSLSRALGWPSYGLARIQWKGPWMAPSVPVRARYRYTHWVGFQTTPGESADLVWDINACNDVNRGWLTLEVWAESLVPMLTADIKRASGDWHVTHAIEVARP